jgi:hypothetical protein
VLEVTYENKPIDGVVLAAWMFFHTWIFGGLILFAAAVFAIPPTLTIAGSRAPLGLKVLVVTVPVLVGVGFAVLAALLFQAAVSFFAKSPGVYTTHQLKADADGLTESSPVNESRFAWSAVTRVARTKRYLYVFVGPLKAHILPRRDFPDDGHWDELHQNFLALWTAGRA